MILYLIRHPRPAGAAGLCYGRRDLTVSEDAIDLSLASVRAGIDAQVLRTATLFSSPAVRCVALAARLAELRAPVLADELLELNFGAWEGLPWAEIPREQLDAWAGDVWSYRPGRMESAADVARRWESWVARLRRSAVGAAVAVTHAGVIRVALCLCGALTTADFARAAIGYGSVHRIELDAPRVFA